MKVIEECPFYSIDKDGNVFNNKTGKKRKIDKNKYGYISVKLYDSSRKRYISRLLHRILMITYKPIPNHSEMQVNHIDGDKCNNSLENLEWVTHMENSIHADTNNLVANKIRRKPISAYNPNGNYIGQFISQNEASRVLRIPQPRISDCCKGKLRDFNGYIFEYS